MKVFIVTQPRCPKCHSLVQRLEKTKEFEYEEVDVSTHTGLTLARESGMHTTPILVVESPDHQRKFFEYTASSIDEIKELVSR